MHFMSNNKRVIPYTNNQFIPMKVNYKKGATTEHQDSAVKYMG